jgi:hypothetical protein
MNVYSDGLDIVYDKYTGVTYSLKLTKKQKVKIGKIAKEYGKLFLTVRQMSELKNKYKLEIPPTFLYVSTIADLKGECTCGMSNLAIYYSGDFIQVIDGYVMSDADAKENEIID